MMTLEEILESWGIDSVIDPTKLHTESISIPSLHNKYYKIYVYEKMRYHKMLAETKQLKLEKYEFYTQGPSSREQLDKGWKLPAAGKILKSEVTQYMEADKDLIDINLKLSLQSEKINFLESIIGTLKNRNYEIKNAIDFIKWQSGS